MNELEFYRSIKESEIDKEINEIINKTQYDEFEKLFGLNCKKCKSNNVVLITYSDIRHGSEYTGSWGDAGIVIKCKDCGNAIKIISHEE